MRFADDDTFKCERLFLSQTINACKISKALMNNPFTRIVMTNLQSSFNVNLTCPYAAGFYEVKNLRIAIPKYLPIPNFIRYCLLISIEGKAKGARNLVTSATITSTGSMSF